MMLIDHATIAEESNLASLFVAQAMATPGAIAIVDDKVWSYGDLLACMHRHVDWLALLDLPPEAAIGILAPRNPELVALLLAVLWSGHAYVPIDPEDPPERAVRLLVEVKCDIILGTTEMLVDLGKAAGQRTLPRTADLADLAKIPENSAGNPSVSGGARLAYVLHTSGSTGKPKGVEVEHRQVVNLLKSARDLLQFGPEDRYLAVSTLAFDISVVELFLPLTVGGSLLLRDRSLLRDPYRLRESIEMHGVTVAQLGPSTWALLLSGDVPLPRLRVAISTGEAISQELATRLADCADLAWNLYGPTETTVWCTGYRLEPGKVSDKGKSFSPIGRPIGGYEAFVLDDEGSVSKGSAEGELLIAGKGLARGYRHEPALTELSFPYLGPNRSRTYRTGDLVRRDDDGLIHYIGRIDDQIKVAGVRIEPREVEAALLESPEIREAAATWYETEIGHRGIVVAVVWSVAQPPSFEALHTRLSQKLPRAMLPSRFMSLDALPATTSGKVDRRAIRFAAAHRVNVDEPAYARALNMTDTEAKLSMVWQSILGIDHVDSETHFFASGGDSLSAIRMVLDAQKLFETEIDQGAIWAAPRLFEYALVVEKARRQPNDLVNVDTVFPVVKTGDGLPFFFCNVDTRLGLGNTWQADCPLYAVSQWSLGRGFVKASSIEELAAAQISEIKRVQARGPYRIGGYSLGGLIAHEIARKLHDSGDDVELLFLLDPMAPVRYRPARSKHSIETPGYQKPATGVRVMRHLTSVMQSGRGDRIARMVHYIRQGIRWRVTCPLNYFFVDLYGRRASPLTRYLLPRNRWPAFWHLGKKLAYSYLARPYDGHVLAVFHRHDERLEIWKSLMPETAKIAVIETTHLGFFAEPWMGKWIELLSADLLAGKGRMNDRAG